MAHGGCGASFLTSFDAISLPGRAGGRKSYRDQLILQSSDRLTGHGRSQEMSKATLLRTGAHVVELAGMRGYGTAGVSRMGSKGETWTNRSLQCILVLCASAVRCNPERSGTQDELAQLQQARPKIRQHIPIDR